MTHPISESTFRRLSEWVSAHLGLYFPHERWADLQRGIRTAGREFGFDDPAACAEWLTACPVPTRGQLDVLAAHLTVGETYFFREPRSFECLERRILPELALDRRRVGRRYLRIWSAGCCTGEEPYSVAISLTRALPDLPDWDVTLLATDVNPRFLQRAAEGRYGNWSFRAAPGLVGERHFRRVPDGRVEVLPEVKRLVRFAQLNLAEEDAFPSPASGTQAMDVILCRNVLMYLAPGHAGRVVGRLGRALAGGGWLIVGATEAALVATPEFASVSCPGAAVYRKRGQPTTADGGEARAGAGEQRARPVQTEASMEVDAPPPRGITESGQTKEVVARAAAACEAARYAEAAAALQPLVSAGEAPAEALALMARARANQGALGEALGWCDRAVAADKTNPRFHYLRATVLQEQGRVDEAAGALRRAIYMEADFVMAHVALGHLALSGGRREEGQKHFGRARALLGGRAADAVVPQSDGLTAGRLTELIAPLARGEVRV
jgi:chemotaxis protein methyltransferase CheR